QMTGAEALTAACLKPITLKAKEGLALVNGTQLMTALGVLTLIEAKKLVDVAEASAAMAIEAMKGSHAPFDLRVADLRPHPGHRESSIILKALLADSAIAQSHADCHKVQDAYSMRCIPQVHGAVRDAIKQVENVLSVEINAVTDNPLVFPDGSVVSQGNFHGEPVAMALDMLTIALSELASISERRIDKLMNPVFSELPAFLVPDGHEGLNSGMMILHYTTASLVSENKILSHPAVVDSVPTSNDKEDHVSMGATAARKAAKVLTHTRWVIASELMASFQGLSFHPDLQPGIGVQAVYQELSKHISKMSADRSLHPDIQKIDHLITTGNIHTWIQPFIDAS
ncbi:MAG: aromatic amino acid lyase, partial [Vampirovibrio sp.]|nr:aromatic amino acid lyase [Vampirovibrio sp.]